MRDSKSDYQLIGNFTNFGMLNFYFIKHKIEFGYERFESRTFRTKKIT